MPPWRDPPPGRCCYVSLARKFPFSCYSKGPLRELPGAPQNDARAGVCSRPESASRGRREAAPAPRRAGFAPRLRPRYRGGRRRLGAAPRRRARAAPPPAPSSGRAAVATSRPQPRRRPAACLSASLRGAPPTGSRSGSIRVAMWPTAAIALKGRFLRRRGRSRCTFFSQAPSSVPSLDSYRVSPPEGPPGPH